MTTEIRLIGDVHGNMTPIRLAVRLNKVVLQLGDLGFRKDWGKIARLQGVFVCAGNHDELEAARQTPCYLGDFGDLGEKIPGASGIFFVRGAESLDRELRTEGKDWWADEELTAEEMGSARKAYLSIRPHTVLSHEAPSSVVDLLEGKAAIHSRTTNFLNDLLKIHRPRRCYFGHHHRFWIAEVEQTLFRCLAIDEAVDIATKCEL
jgi:predicted phosphodiesterase